VLIKSLSVPDPLPAVACQARDDKREKAEKDKKRQVQLEREAESLKRDLAQARAWLKRVEKAYAAHESAWLAFQGGSKVPWPDWETPNDMIEFALKSAQEAGRKAHRDAFRRLSLRWHPDKFLQAVGGLEGVPSRERDRILTRVTSISKIINQYKP